MMTKLEIKKVFNNRKNRLLIIVEEKEKYYDDKIRNKKNT